MGFLPFPTDPMPTLLDLQLAPQTFLGSTLALVAQDQALPSGLMTARLFVKGRQRLYAFHLLLPSLPRSCTVPVPFHGFVF